VFILSSVVKNKKRLAHQTRFSMDRVRGFKSIRILTPTKVPSAKFLTIIGPKKTLESAELIQAEDSIGVRIASGARPFVLFFKDSGKKQRCENVKITKE
jgi:hypothetical protein